MDVVSVVISIFRRTFADVQSCSETNSLVACNDPIFRPSK